MPLPERYQGEVPDMAAIWQPEAYFNTQTEIWQAQCEARHELYGAPTAEQLEEIRIALQLTPDDVGHLVRAHGHETNKLLRKIQERLSPEAGNFLHLGNTSSDVLDTSLALQMLRSLDIVRDDFTTLKDSLGVLALRERNVVQVGRTHGQHAIPQTFGRQVVGWYADVDFGVGRIDHAREAIAFGKCSGEVGTNVFIEPELEEKALAKLGLKPYPAPTQIIPRTQHAEVLGLMAVNSVTLARIANNIRTLSITEIGEVREPFEAAAQQGSSAMPHKRNPELCERVIGLDRVVRGAAGAELEASVVLFERDMSHSSTERFTFPDTFGNLAYATRLMTKIVNGLVIDSDMMSENLNRTYRAIYSPRLLNALVDRGASRTQSYELVKGLALSALQRKVSLYELASQNEEIRNAIDQAELDSLFDVQFYLRNIDVAYRRMGLLP